MGKFHFQNDSVGSDSSYEIVDVLNLPVVSTEFVLPEVATLSLSPFALALE